MNAINGRSHTTGVTCGFRAWHLTGPSRSGWGGLLDLLAADPVIAVHFAVLPVQSLHVTVKNHETAMVAAPSRDAWDAWFEAVLLGVAQPTSPLRAMMAACERYDYAPVAEVDLQQGPWTASHSTLQLVLRLHNDAEPLRNDLTALGSRAAEPGFVFHMTLAYRYRRASNDEDRAALNARLANAFDAAMALAKAPLT